MGIIYKNNDPYIEEQNLVELTNSIPTPFYAYSQKKINDSVLELKKNLNKDIYFSIKANSNQAIIKLINSLGVGFDVVSIEEMERALYANVSPKKIIFEGVGKSEKDIAYAINKDIKQINVESIEELQLVNNISKKINKKPYVGLRINPDIHSKSLDKISTGRKNDKFGIDFNQLNVACEILKTLNDINFIGLSCHIGSQIFQIDIFKKIFEKMKEAIEIFESNNFKINYLNLGGGFGISYENDSLQLNITELANLINKMFPNPSYEISFEPGRFIVARAGFIVTKILTKKQNGGVNFLITDAGMQTLIRPAMYNTFHKILPFNTKGENITYTIGGPICESSDILAKKIILPKQRKDNFLIICDVGAYGSVMSSNYNSKCLPAEILINKNQYSIIRNHESINSLIERDIIPNWL